MFDVFAVVVLAKGMPTPFPLVIWGWGCDSSLEMRMTRVPLFLSFSIYVFNLFSWRRNNARAFSLVLWSRHTVGVWIIINGGTYSIYHYYYYSLTLGEHLFLQSRRTFWVNLTLCTFWLCNILNILIRFAWKKFEMCLTRRRNNWCSQKIFFKWSTVKIIMKKMIKKRILLKKNTVFSVFIILG